MRLIRVFPRKTKATPTDELAYFGPPDLFAEADRVHVSVTFTWDKPAAERLADQWRHVAPVEVGGPAYGDPGGYFTPGRYLRPGYVITSRGCPRHCRNCLVPSREGPLRELPIRDGWLVQDNNLLACSWDHFLAVLAMLRRQDHRTEFVGGLEAGLLMAVHVHELSLLMPRPVLWFAYDSPADYEEVRFAVKLLVDAGWSTAGHRVRCYVLIGQPGDTIEAAQKRLEQVVDLGAMPMAMLWRNEAGEVPSEEWRRFQRLWARPAIIAARRRV